MFARMKTVAIENASLLDLLLELRGEDEILLTDHAEPVAKLVSITPAAHVPNAATLQKRREALTALKQLGGLRDVIGDPQEWQRAIRLDRPLPLID
jgi:antitoxin (DNA-binding transcriptional repressor) of toxin-antitoxin stability system